MSIRGSVRCLAVVGLVALLVGGGVAPGEACPDLVGRWPYGPVQAVATQGTFAYAGSGAGLLVVSVSNPASPAVVGRMMLPDVVRGVAVSGSYIYVADSESGLRVVNVANPSSPVEVGFLDTPSDAYGVAVSGAYAYVADYLSGLRIIDVSTPSAPVEVSVLDTPGYAYGVAVSGGHAYVVDYQTLRVVDVANPSAPVEVGSLALPGWAANGVTVAGTYAYVADADGGLRIVDVATPSTPVEVGFLTTWGESMGVGVSGSHAFVADRYAGFRVVNVSNPAMPVEVAYLETAGDVMGVAVAGAFAYLAEDDAGVAVVDVSSASAPHTTGIADTPGEAISVAVSGAYAYVAAEESGLRVVDVSTPAAPVEAGSYDTPGEALGVAVSGSYAYVADRHEGLRVVDVSTPSAPVEAGFLEATYQVSAVAASWPYAYVVDGSLLRVVSVLSPSAPVEVGSCSVPSANWPVSGMTVAGSYVYIADSSQGLRIVDVSTPGAPVEVGFWAMSGEVHDVAVSGSTAYVAAFNSGLRVVDVSNPRAPVEVGSFLTPALAYGVAVSGSHAFVADGYGSLVVVDVSNPQAPVEVGSHDTPGYAQDVAVSGSHIIVAEGEAGLEVFADCNAERLWVPASAHATGVNAFWLTDLELHNRGASAASGTIAMLVRDQANPAPATVPVTVPAGQSVRLADVLSLFGVTSGTAALRLEIEGGDVLVTSRTFNQTSSGTYGQFIPGQPESEAIGFGEEARLIQLSDSVSATDGFRTNVGLVNIGASPIEVVIALFQASGTPAGTSNQHLRAYEYKQLNDIQVTVGAGDLADGFAVVSTTTAGGHFLAYASVVDNRTADPVYIRPQRAMAQAGGCITATAHADGVGGTQWRSDLELHNPGTAVATAGIRLLVRDQANPNPASTVLSIDPGESVRWEDVLMSLFGFTGSASLLLDWQAGELMITSRTFNQGPNGTYGQFIPLAQMGDAAEIGDEVRLIQLTDSTSTTTGFRTNIGLVNVTASPADLVVELYAADGSPLGTRTQPLAEYGYKQLTDIQTVLGVGDVADGFAIVRTTTTGGRFFAYASVVDNITGDPVYIPGM